MCRTHSATKTKILFLKWWWILIEKGHKVSESMTFSNFSRTFRNAEKSPKDILNARWETAGANNTYKAQPQPKANQKENEPKRWLIFWIGERWVKVIGERGEPKRWIRKFLNLQKLSGVLFSRRWRLMSFHKRRAEFVAMPHIATYRISGRPLIPIVYSSCFLLLPELQTAQTARPRSSSVEKRCLYYFHLNYPTTGL